MQCDDGTLCCNAGFDFDFTGIDMDTLRFYVYEGTKIILVVYVKNGTLYFSISFDCGQTFQDPKKILDIKGVIKDIQILASEDKFVIALKESVNGQNFKRAIRGVVDPKANKFVSKECTEHKPAKKGQEIINVALGVRKWAGHEPECETVDYVFERDGNRINVVCQGHGTCKVI